jgi:hypothetical protein
MVYQESGFGLTAFEAACKKRKKRREEESKAPEAMRCGAGRD